MTTVVGYARVSTFEQFLDLQQDALRVAGCTRIFTDTRHFVPDDTTWRQMFSIP